jgi:prevent-host-death family protein
MTVSELRSRLADTISDVAFGRQRVIISRRGKDRAAIVPIEDLRLLQQYLDLLEGGTRPAPAEHPNNPLDTPEGDLEQPLDDTARRFGLLP